MKEINIEIGKYTLESLTTGMYTDPKIVYREYIQNSVDALEDAVSKGILDQDLMRIDIVVDQDDSRVLIRDNGTGIPKDLVGNMLLDIGNSRKRHTNNRGFRGIGRLGGMSYCNRLVFITSALDEDQKTILSFDCKKLRNMLIPGQYADYDLKRILHEVTTITYEDESVDSHYFIVEMNEVDDFSDLLSFDDVRRYICQVAPLAYSDKHFYVWGREIKKYLTSRNYEIAEFPVYLGTNESNLVHIFKPNKARFDSDRQKRRKDEISNLVFFDIEEGGELLATGWYGYCNWYGTISDAEITGLRIRKGNILIGDSKTMSGIFRESRFNGWVQGEIFVFSDAIIPNARRDDFEQNDKYIALIKNLSETIGNDISKIIREASSLRNDPSMRIIQDVEQVVKDALTASDKGFNSRVDKQKILSELSEGEQALKKVKDSPDIQHKKESTLEKVRSVQRTVEESNNYRINSVSSRLDRKSKRVLMIVSDILSSKLSKFLVDDILEEIVQALNSNQRDKR